MRNALVKALLLVSIAACASKRPDKTGGGSGDAGVDGMGSQECVGCATVSGKVYAPKWAPGDVPPGQEIPIFGAVIWVSSSAPDPIPDHVFCESCIDAPQGGVLSSHDGTFSLTVPPGHYFLTIQKGQFRLTQEMDLVAGMQVLAPPETTLPSKMDPAHGAWIPRIAIARGNYDAVEDILGKIGFGSMAGNKLSNPVGENSFPEITFYDWDTTGNRSVTYLLQNVAEMRKYHIIFFPCSTDADDFLLADQTVLKNIRQFVAEGGKLYVTDWSGETADRAFPHQLQLGDDGFGDVDSEGSYDPTALTGTLTVEGTADGNLYTSDHSKAVDQDLAQWLGLQVGPSEIDPTPHIYNADDFPVTDNWNWIVSLNDVAKGLDMNSQTVYDKPKAWVTGSDSGQNAGPLAVTYEPAGCGKVLYSTFQTSGSSAIESHTGLMPQERVLLFLIMEISSCTQNPVIL
jgi:hypothetical protein